MSIDRRAPERHPAVPDHGRRRKKAQNDESCCRARRHFSLGAGEPDFDTPPHIIDAAKQALDEGKTRYTGGQRRTGTAGCDHRQNSNATTGWSITRDEIHVSCGGKPVIFNAMMATLDPGDEVIVPAPYLGQLSGYRRAVWRRSR